MELLASVIGQIDEDTQEILLKWPPFFTIQDHAEIRAKQLKYWSEIAFSHFKKHGIWEASLQQIAQPSFTIFQEQNAYNSNACRLTSEEILLILEEMDAQGKISWKNSELKTNFFVNRHSCYELSDAIYNWARNAGKIGSIETLKWISEGEDTEKSEKFYGVREELILKSAKILEADGRAQVFPLENGKFGVKFK